MRFVIISAILLAGCATERGGTSVVSRDSAGVQIREIEAAAAASPQLREDAAVSIGAGDAGPDYQFVDIAGALILSDGRIVVADRELNAVRYFDSEGRLQGSIGRAGDGPGEFRGLQAIGHFAGDTIYAFDRRLQRLTVIDEAGRVAFIVKLPLHLASVYPLSDRRWIGATAEGHYGATLDEQAQPGLKRTPAPILVLSPDGAVVDTLVSPPGEEQAYIRAGDRVGVVPAAFGRILSLAVRGQQVYVSTGEIHGFDLYEPDLGLMQSVRIMNAGDLTVRGSDVAAFRSAILGEIPDSAARSNFAAVLQMAETPRTKAPVSRITIDDRGWVWLSEYENPYFSTGAWHIVDSDSRYRGRVAVPVGFRLQEVRGTNVVGIWRDELGLQSVRVYQLHGV